ncbi:MAG: alpha-ketoacid dehydrogenase subunit beta [Nitrospinaceae bacterium]|nr:alpha-ketoacid dehydrogenase subunit beta [Nitrospinaceae bacterium]
MDLMDKKRLLKYREALNEGLVQAMDQDDTVFVMGCGVDDDGGIFGTTKGAFQKFGTARVMDVPLAENAIAGIGIGAAVLGKRPVVVHARNDFLLLAMDQIVNHAAKWKFMSGNQLSCPLVIRAIVGRGWGQAAQHSQSLQALFSHVPGLTVALPASPYDAKGLLLSALQADDPVISIEHRLLYETQGPVPAAPYTVPLGKAAIKRTGGDVTVVAFSYMVKEALEAADRLSTEGIQMELVDPRCASPLDLEPLLASVRKTRRLVVADTGWKAFGLSAEIAARVSEELFAELEAPVQRVALPHLNTPCSANLEREFYPGVDDILRAVHTVLGTRKGQTVELKVPSAEHTNFQGPF